MLMETRQPKGYKYITLYIIFVNPALRGVFMRKPSTQSWVCHFFLGKLTLFFVLFLWSCCTQLQWQLQCNPSKWNICTAPLWLLCRV